MVKAAKKGAQRIPSAPAGIPPHLADRIAAGEVVQSRNAKGDELNGFHKITFEDGDKYEGYFLSGVFHGQGQHVFPDGEEYKGEWGYGVQHGTGSKTWADGTTYVGQYRDDQRSGHGVGKWPSGIEYNGEWLENQFHGHGTLRWPTGCEVPGSYFVVVDDKGEESVSYGKVYHGEFAEGKKNGAGLLMFYDGSQYSGKFVAETFEGKGTMKYTNGDSYEGMWAQGVYHGRGNFTKKDKSELYVGDFHEGMREGGGKLTFSNGGSFEGGFKAGKRAGRGVHCYPDGRKVEGEWWQFGDTRNELPQKVQQTLIATHFLGDDVILEQMKIRDEALAAEALEQQAASEEAARISSEKKGVFASLFGWGKGKSKGGGAKEKGVRFA